VRDSGLLGDYWRKLAVELPPGLDAWARAHLDQLITLDEQAAQAVAGQTLLHLDIRADNMLLNPERVAFVDWPHARRGAGWFDLLFFAPSVVMQGGPQPDELLALYPGQLPDVEQLVPALAAIAGFFTWGALQPPPPGLPFLRQFQNAQGIAARAWLARHLAR
jgi:aminoglycoside phosphotransferase (APT) family kinase protein